MGPAGRPDNHMNVFPETRVPMTELTPSHPALVEILEAARRLEQAEHARAQALRAWEVSDEPYPLNAAIALEAAERDLRLARRHLESVQQTLAAAPPMWSDDKSWGSH